MIRILTALAVMLVGAALHAQQSELRIRAARVLDGTGQVLANAAIVVSGSRIIDIDASGSRPADIDLGQSTLLPGLIDVHSHIGWHFGPNGRYEPRAATPAQDVLYAAENAYVTLMAGFTTIQSPGQPGDVDLRDAIARGVLPGPRVLTSIVQIVPTTGTPVELRQTVRELKRLRADVVKIIDAVGGRGGVEQTMSGEQWQALCGEARAQGLRTMVHAQTTESVRAAIDAGCMQIEHGVGVDAVGFGADGRARRVFRSECRSRDAELPSEQGKISRRGRLHRGELRVDGTRHDAQRRAHQEGCVDARPETRAGIRCRRRRSRTQCRRAGGTCAAGRTSADGRDCLRDIACRRIAGPGKDDREDCAAATRPTSSQSMAIRRRISRH